MKRRTKKKREPGSLHRIVVLRLVTRWRREAKVFQRELGAAIDTESRAELSMAIHMLNVCAGQLEKAARLNDPSSPTAADHD